MKRIAISVFSSGPLLTILSLGAAAQFGLAPIAPMPAPQLPGIKAPLMLPIPIEQPRWPTLEIYVTPRLSPSLPQMPVIRLPYKGESTRPMPAADLPAPVIHAVRVSGRAAQTRRPVAENLRETRRAFRMEGRGRQPSAENLRAVFDGLQKDQGPGVVDTRPETEDEVEGSPVAEQPLPWLEPSRPVTLPEWDLEREIGLR